MSDYAWAYLMVGVYAAGVDGGVERGVNNLYEEGAK